MASQQLLEYFRRPAVLIGLVVIFLIGIVASFYSKAALLLTALYTIAILGVYLIAVTRTWVDVEETSEDDFKGESSEAADPGMDIFDDTQASVFFNQTSDIIISLIHQAFKANTTFLYLWSESDREWILQSFRSESDRFSTRSRWAASDDSSMSALNALLLDPKPYSSEGQKMFFYEGGQPELPLSVVPLARRNVLLGALGIDRALPLGVEETDTLVQYAHLLVQTIQNIDGIYLKNKLRRMQQVTKDYQELIASENQDDLIISHLVESVRQNIAYDSVLMWLRAPNHQWELVKTFGSKLYDTGTVMVLTGRNEGQALATGSRSYVGQAVFKGQERTLLSVPVIDQGHCFGILHLERHFAQAWDLYDVQFIETMCYLAGLALARVHLDTHIALQTSIDPLTRMVPLRAFCDQMADEIERAKRFSMPFSLVVFGLDYLKHIYENFGIPGGDLVIEKAASIIHGEKRHIDVAGRLGQDRLALMLVNNSVNEAKSCAARVLEKLRQTTVTLQDRQILLDARIGVATYGPDGQEVTSLLDAAERSMLQSQKSSNVSLTD
ncbi:MAG: sensor domain-containing diguanylate cyclase [Bacteroidetes bacterium]|nr:sensor domain-containing diguanylate cyclase [Bacteroidota bacterium]